jgi:hypothetical protein
VQFAGHLMKQVMELESTLIYLNKGNLVGLIYDSVLDWYEFFSWQDIPESSIKVLIER